MPKEIGSMTDQWTDPSHQEEVSHSPKQQREYPNEWVGSHPLDKEEDSEGNMQKTRKIEKQCYLLLVQEIAEVLASISSLPYM